MTCTPPTSNAVVADVSATAMGEALACPRHDDIACAQLERLTRLRSNQNSRDVRFPNYVLARVGTQVAECLLCHVINVSHVVLQARHAPPETKRVCKS